MYTFPDMEDVRRLIRYFIRNWVGCRRVAAMEPIPHDDLGEGYGDYWLIDVYIREWIEQNGLQNRRETFRINFWNVSERIEENFARTNNSTEAWHRVWNSLFRSIHPRISEFVKTMVKEDIHWSAVVEDYVNSPADGIRGKGQGRRQDYLDQDENIREIFQRHRRAGEQYHPLEYLRAIGYRMPDPI